MIRHILPTAVLSFVFTILIALSSLADGSSPALYFTDNLTAVSTSPAITVMEQALLDRIQAAASSIDAAIYDFERVSVRDALLAAHTRGVTVRVVADDEARANPSYAPHFAALTTAGIPVVDDQDDGRIMHNKYLIIDRQAVWTGSTNLSDNDITLNHNNAIFFAGAEIASLYQTDFDQMFSGRFGNQKTPSPVTNVSYNGISVEVYFSPQDEAMAELIAEVEAAQTSIDFAIFFFTEDALRDALIAAHNRGVRVRGLWDVLGAGNASSDDEALCAAGIPIKLENTSGKMHNKLMVVDAQSTSPRVITGSLNWTDAGDNRNSENTVIVHDALTVQSHAQNFQTMWTGITAEPCVPELVFTEILYLPVVVRAGDGATPGPNPTSIPTTAPTPSPTSIPTTEPSNDVRLVRIVYNPDGEDVMQGERVEIRNPGSMAVEMTGWALSDEAANRYVFPSFTLPGGATAAVWAKAGTDNGTDLYWGRTQAVWNNDGDTATLATGNGIAVDICVYIGGGSEIGCE